MVADSVRSRSMASNWCVVNLPVTSSTSPRCGSSRTPTELTRSRMSARDPIQRRFALGKPFCYLLEIPLVPFNDPLPFAL